MTLGHQSRSLDALTAADFEPHRGAGFGLAAAGGEIALRLVEVNRAGPALRAGGAFSLLFVSDPGPFLPQATYPISHPALGTLELFLVPLGRKHGGNGYEAVFT
jgi:hypothetical protein